MEQKAETVVQNIGAVAETVSIFYNSISKQVPKDVALILTQHFMDLTIVRRNAPIDPAAIAAAIQAAERKRRAMQQRPAPQAPGTDAPTAQPQDNTHEPSDNSPDTASEEKPQ